MGATRAALYTALATVVLARTRACIRTVWPVLAPHSLLPRTLLGGDFTDVTLTAPDKHFDMSIEEVSLLRMRTT